MSVQVLVATMDQYDHSLVKKMNIQTSAIISNQCERNEIEEFNYKGNEIKFLSFKERGVGLNRNNALMRSDADICIVADDDIVFVDNYFEIINKYFNENPSADVIIFNLIEKPEKRYVIRKEFKVGFHNFMKFGATRIAFRRKSVTKSGITFNLHFGGGAEFSAGEDTLFLHECLKKNLNILAIPEFISKLTDTRDSSWFEGYTDKYFIDRGALFACISKRWAWLLCLQFAIRHRKKFVEDKSFVDIVKLMNSGIKKISESK